MTDLNAVATAAAQSHATKNPARADAIESLRRIIESSDRDPNDWAEVYAGLLRPRVSRAKPKTARAWVAKAVAQKDVREALNYIYSDGERIMATDGHRLHIHEVEAETGFSEPNGDRVKLPGKVFPDIDRVIPSGKLKKYAENLRACPRETSRGYGDVVCLPCGRAIREPYLIDALAGDETLKYEVKAIDPPYQTPIKLHTRYGIAVIMPVRD